MSKEKEMKQHLQQYDKDTLIELYLQKDFDTRQQLAEKDKELQKEKDALNWYQKDYAKQMEDLAETLAEKDKEIEELKANQTPTRKKLSPKNWDKYNLADKLRYRNSQVKEALIRMSDMNEMEDVLRSKLTEKNKEIELANQKITILERALLNTCTELQESGNGYVNLAGSILKPENAMEIEYEVALSDLGLIVPEEGLCKYCGCNYDFEKQLKDQRHQICEKAKNKLKNHCFWANGEYTGWYIEEEKIDLLLDQIEKENRDE